MRVITPLMTSTYLDLTKDTTLGVLIGFTEVTAVIKTSANNTGNAVETILVLVAVFLSISLPVSAAINAYNRDAGAPRGGRVMTILLEGAHRPAEAGAAGARRRPACSPRRVNAARDGRRRRPDRRRRSGGSLRWAVFDAAWSGGAEACRARAGACWPFVRANAQLMAFGVYPQDLLWRPSVEPRDDGRR